MPSLTELFREIPFLSAYRNRESQIQQEGQNELRQAGTLMQILGQVQAQQEKQKAAALEAQGRAALARLPPGAKDNDVMAALTPFVSPAERFKAAASAAGKNTLQGLPSFVQLQELSKAKRATGDTAGADQIDAYLKRQTQTETSASQENMNFLLEVQKKVSAGQPLSPDERNKAILIHRQMTAPRVDIATGAQVRPDFGAAFDPERNFGNAGSFSGLQADVVGAMPGSGPTVGMGSGIPQDIQAQIMAAAAQGKTASIADTSSQPAAAVVPPVIPPSRVVREEGKPTPQTRLAKLNADLKTGLITQEQYANSPEVLTAAQAPEAVVDAIVSGRMQMPTGFALRSPYWQDVIARVAQKDPSFDATRYGARSAARRTFASGPEARNVTALNTVIGHLGTLDEAANALMNKDIRAFNAVANRLATELGDPRVQSFDTARQAVAEETMRVFRQVGASEMEARMWGERIQSSGSPAQLRGVIATLGELLESRVNAIASQFERTVNQGGNPAQVDPANKAVLDRLIKQGSPQDLIRQADEILNRGKR